MAGCQRSAIFPFDHEPMRQNPLRDIYVDWSYGTFVRDLTQAIDDHNRWDPSRPISLREE